MADTQDKDKTPAQTAKAAAKDVEPKENAEQLSVEERLIPQATDFFGAEYSSAHVAGPLLATGRKQLTVAEAKTIVDKAAKAEVTSDLPEQS